MSEFAEMLRNGVTEVKIPSGVWNLDEPLILGTFKDGISGDRWHNQILRGETGTILVSPTGLPAVQVFGNYQECHDFEAVGNGAEGIKLGISANDYVGHSFTGTQLRIRNATTGFYNGKFDGSVLRDCDIRFCDVNVHSTGNQDSLRLDNVKAHKASVVALKADMNGKIVASTGVFGGNRKVAHAGGTNTGEAGSITFVDSHFEGLTQEDLETPALDGTSYTEAAYGSQINFVRVFFASGASLWPAAVGGASCVLTFDGGNPYYPRANGSCRIVAPPWMKLKSNYNGVADFYATQDWMFV